MSALAKVLYEKRNEKGLVVRSLAFQSGIDPALISKYEKGSRLPTEDNLKALTEALQIPFEEARKMWLAEKVYNLLAYEENAGEILALAESRVAYLSGQQALTMEELSGSIQDKLKQIDDLKAKWQSRRPLNITQLQKMQEFFHIAYTFESNRIEGNTLSLQETHLVVNEGITIGGKSMREHLEAINHAEAISYMEQLVTDQLDYSPRVLMELHYLILKGIDKDNAGKYRSVPVRISGSEHVPPQPFLLQKMMEEYFLHYDRQKRRLHPVILAAEMHERLVSIHPFIDGNGRSSRLVMNLILLKRGYTIANLKGDLHSRLAYYKALEAVQVDNNPEAFYHLVVDAVKDSLERHLELV
ncbi:Fic family protein [Aquiflexum sp. TKW24L]|uniref:Fic family protein n=1 Tax=Aquiflexum sp. TKW24L TaxID=2942212 RepID=UPI0020BF09D8|nr:Fic family protein [Aquiflexum sp. TKW24L]MCL6260548.1 Fic family protein [Aquiflexum sp. TKW24L]